MLRRKLNKPTKSKYKKNKIARLNVINVSDIYSALSHSEYLEINKKITSNSSVHSLDVFVNKARESADDDVKLMWRRCFNFLLMKSQLKTR